jgi:hypothetical protein
MRRSIRPKRAVSLALARTIASSLRSESCKEVERQSLPLGALGSDFYHLSENVYKARREIEATPTRRASAGPASCSTSSSATVTRRPESGCWSRAWR